MNKERIEQLAVAIETHSIDGLGFNMGFFRFTGGAADASGHDCGTVACIAGTAVALGKLSGTFGAAAEWLDIPYDKVGQELFYPGDASGIRVRDWALITPAHAAAVLRRLAETGRVDWTAVLPEEMIKRPEDEE
ncbi:hypothetical protein M0Q28_06150 [Patescibacteria group bacterium]|jgi:hypothetical protein|nr:hypothetical protein [Patescibacteria group bacterium]